MAILTRIFRLFRGFLNLFVSAVEEKSPEALFEEAKQEFHGKLAQYNRALAQLAGIAERLKLQLKSKMGRIQELDRRILANHRAGNNELAGTLARELQELKEDIGHDAEELKETEIAYEANIKNAKAARKDFEERIRQFERQLSQVKLKEAQAEASAALSGVAFNTGDMGDTMKRVQEILEKRYQTAAGKSRVTFDMAEVERTAEKEGERKALEQQALADYLAERGVESTQLTSGNVVLGEVVAKKTPS